MVRSGPFWDHVTEKDDGLHYCKFCNHKFAKDTSIFRIKSHLSGVGGGGAKICTGVPVDVKEAACLAIQNKNKKRKTMTSSSQNELRNTGSTFSTEQANGTEIPFPTVDVESMQTEVMSMEFRMETTDFLPPEAADWVENMSLEFMQHVGTSSSHERLLVDAPNIIREDAFPTTDLVSQVTQQDRQQLCKDGLPGNSRDNSRAVETTDFPFVEAADPVENMSIEFMQPVGTSIAPERFLVDAPNNIREDTFPTTDIVSQVGPLNWQQTYDFSSLIDDDLPGNSRDNSQSLGVIPLPDFEEFESRESVSKQIVAALKDPNVNKVGVYGMGGTGKTTLAEKVGAELQLNGTFSYVVLATVSEKQNQLKNNYQSDLLNIQKQIAEGLEIQLQGETLNGRATQLHGQLQKKDKVLIILDDIWSKFELEKVGIPVGSSVLTKFKILMTSRNRIVLENEMDVDSRNNFGLDSLPPDDAKKLFDKMVGGDREYSNWPLIAQQVVVRCGGIPILLATTGRALRNEKDRSIWEDALTQLKLFYGCDFDDDAYKRIEVSYKFLKDEEKKLFLLCAQLDHRSIGLEDLLRYTMGLDLFKGRTKLKEVRGRLHKYLRDLKGCCLLQDGNKEGIIKMHDVVHKFASVVAFRDHHVFSVANDGELDEWPSKNQFEKFTAISFFYCRLPSDHELPVAFDNPKLESFLMLRNKPESFLMLRSRIDEIDASFKIPDNFFAGSLKGLKLMHLTRMSLSPALVSSLSALEKIRTLCLDHCELGDIAVIGELRMLQALSLIGSSIVWVPKEIGKLGRTLKLLDLRDCSKLKSIASGVISKLTLLEDLRIGDSFEDWERLEVSDESNNSADMTYEAEVTSLEEFKNLRNLINLEIHIREHAKMFPKDLVFKNLETFRIFFGSDHQPGNYCILPRTLEVIEFSAVVEFASEGTKALITRAESLHLGGVESSVSVSEMGPKGFPELKHLKVNSGDGIQYIVNKNYNNCIFPKLETLALCFLHKLERICDDYDRLLPVGSFENLTSIIVKDCDLFNDLFSSNLARGLLRLKEIRVEDCERMESIIVSRESENEEEITIGFTQELRALTLCKLPRLLSFYRFNQLEGVPSPTLLFNKKIVFPKLEELDLSMMKIEKIWDDHLAIAAEGTCWFQNLTSLRVYSCDNLSYLFTFSIVKSFSQLKNLHISCCKSIKKIVATSKGEMEGERLLLFPKLETLELSGLHKLERICDDHDHPLPTGSFENLTSIIVKQCDLLNDLLSSNMARGLLRLKEIRVEYCKSMESIIVSRESENEEEIPIGFTDELRVLKLHRLSRLVSFCSFKQLEGVPSATPLFNKKIVFPKLEKLDLNQMKIEKIWDDNLAIAAEGTCWFQNLTSLKVAFCENLSYLFTFSMVKSFAQLKKLCIGCCKSIEEIVATRKGEMEGEGLLLFPKLEYLALLDLPKLNFFCHAKLLQCQSLQRVFICSCPRLNAFISTNDSAPDLETNSTTLFDENVVNTIECDTVTLVLKLSKIVFPKLEKLTLVHIKVENIWNDESSISAGRSSWLQNLTSLTVDECGNLSYLFTSSMVKNLAKLKQLEVDNCQSIEEIVASTEREMAGEIQLSFPKLDDLTLKDLPNLKRFCHANLLECRLLRELRIQNCRELKTFISTNDSSPDNLTTLFNEKVAFPNMEKLEIIGCGSLEKLFDVQILAMNERETCRILPFQKLRSVVVSECPTLTSIFPASLVPTLQQLERLEVRKCDKIDLFGFNDTQQLNDAFAKVISSMKHCYLESGGMNRMIVNYEHNSRSNIWKLKIDGCNNIICYPILFALLKSFPKLDKVEVSSSSIIFPCESDHLAADDGNDMDTQAKTLARIQRLQLTKLSNMKHIWSEHSPLKYHGIPRDPKVLEVRQCDSLLSLAPPSTTLFKNVTGLVVWSCPMLIKLVASSNTAKSLVNLKEMSVSMCHSLEEIVVIDDQRHELASNDEYIIFDKLEVLKLQYLNSLTSFYSTSDCNFRFPSLNRVIMRNCPKMKFFSKGAVNTPKLTKAIVEDPFRKWKGDLNSTIRQFFEEMG